MHYHNKGVQFLWYALHTRWCQAQPRQGQSHRTEQIEQIHKKNLMQAPPHLPRMMLHLQPYDCIVKYLLGREMVTANTLSHLSPLDEFEVPDMNVKIHHLIRITPAKMEEFKEETAKDETLQLLSHQDIQGWPNRMRKIDLH